MKITWLRRLGMSATIPAALAAAAVLASSLPQETPKTAPASTASSAVHLDSGHIKLAANGWPTYRIGSSSNEYWGFINAFRRLARQGSSAVPGSRALVDHTNASATHTFISADIGMWGSENFVRFQFRSSDLYLVGYWDAHNVYHYFGPTGAFDPEIHGPRRRRGPNSEIVDATDRRENDGSYLELERIYGGPRSGLTINRANMNTSLWDLYNNRSASNRAAAILRIITFVSEAARFTPIGTNVGMAMASNGEGWWIRPLNTAMTNAWGQLSARYNQLLSSRTSDAHPLIVEYYDYDGGYHRVILATLLIYPQILNVAKGR
jgi:hypothetical protein